MTTELKLFVWREFCTDYYDGLAFAIAYTEEDAQAIVLAELKLESISDWGKVSVEELTEGVTAAVFGGM